MVRGEQGDAMGLAPDCPLFVGWIHEYGDIPLLLVGPF